MSVGTVEDLGNGRFRARLPRALDKQRKSLGIFGSAEEAHSVINGTLALAQSHHITIPGGETFRSFLAGFLDRRELSGIRNIDRDRRLASAHIETADFADNPLTSIRRVHVKDWLDRLQRKPSKRTGERLKAQTVRNCLNLLRVCLRDAVDRGLIEQNPTVDLKLNRSMLASTDEPWTYLEPAEQEAFLAAIASDGSPSDERRYCAFAMGTGLRPGEQRALQIEDVHLEGDEPYVMVRFGSPGQKPTKTGRTRRVTLFGIALEAAKAQAAALKGKANQKRLFWPSPSFGYRPEGSPEGWNDWLRAAGIDRAVRLYDLRHTFASSLVAGWWGRRWTLEEIKAQLGHTDIKMTQRYAHLGVTAVRTATRETIAAYAGPRLVPNVTQPPEIVEYMAAFVNRRSRVQVSELAPASFSTIHIEAAVFGTDSGSMLGVTFATRHDGLRRIGMQAGATKGATVGRWDFGSPHESGAVCRPSGHRIGSPATLNRPGVRRLLCFGGARRRVANLLPRNACRRRRSPSVRLDQRNAGSAGA